MRFRIFQKRNIPYKTIRTRIIKRLKNWDFFKGLVRGFRQKCEKFLSFYFRQNRVRNAFYVILERKNASLN